MLPLVTEDVSSLLTALVQILFWELGIWELDRGNYLGTSVLRRRLCPLSSHSTATCKART